jgi:hypothetical protein
LDVANLQQFQTIQSSCTQLATGFRKARLGPREFSSRNNFPDEDMALGTPHKICEGVLRPSKRAFLGGAPRAKVKIPKHALDAHTINKTTHAI